MLTVFWIAVVALLTGCVSTKQSFVAIDKGSGKPVPDLAFYAYKKKTLVGPVVQAGSTVSDSEGQFTLNSDYPSIDSVDYRVIGRKRISLNRFNIFVERK